MNIDTTRDHYCTVCYEVVENPVDHREDVHDGDMMIDIWRIHEESDDYIAQADDMGHFSPHVWSDVDDHDVCMECGAVKIKPADLPAKEVEQ